METNGQNELELKDKVREQKNKIGGMLRQGKTPEEIANAIKELSFVELVAWVIDSMDPPKMYSKELSPINIKLAEKLFDATIEKAITEGVEHFIGTGELGQY